MNCVFIQVRTVTSHFPPWHLVWVTAMGLWNNYYLIWTLAQKIVIPFYWRDWSVKFSYSPKLTQKAVAISGYNSISRFQVWAVSIQQKFPVESSRKAGGNGTEEKEVPQLQKWQTQSEKQSLWSITAPWRASRMERVSESPSLTPQICSSLSERLWALAAISWPISLESATS